MIDTTRPSFVRSIVLSWIAGLVLLGTMSACDNGPTPPLGTVDAVVFGTVETITGAPVSGATIQLLAHEDSCAAQPGRFHPVTSDATGRFTRPIAYLTNPSIACFTVDAEAPAESDLGDTTITVEPVDLEFRTDPPFDSLRVDVTLPVR
jgi:hypothetical protein